MAAYPENLTITKPLTLRASHGPVIIELSTELLELQQHASIDDSSNMIGVAQ
jgi:hypothetical protein